MKLSLTERVTKSRDLEGSRLFSESLGHNPKQHPDGRTGQIGHYGAPLPRPRYDNALQVLRNSALHTESGLQRELRLKRIRMIAERNERETRLFRAALDDAGFIAPWCVGSHELTRWKTAKTIRGMLQCFGSGFATNIDRLAHHSDIVGIFAEKDHLLGVAHIPATRFRCEVEQQAMAILSKCEREYFDSLRTEYQREAIAIAQAIGHSRNSRRAMQRRLRAERFASA